MSMTPEAFHACRGQKILVIEPYFYTPEIETGLEISETLATHNSVTFLGPEILQCTTDETYRFRSRVLINCSRKRHVSSYLPGSIPRLTQADIAELAQRPSRSEFAEAITDSCGGFEHAMVDTFDLGTGIRSSLVSLTRDTSVDPKDYRDYVVALGRDAVLLYRLTKELIRRERFEIVALFNGRFAPVRAIRRACEELGTRYFVHERGSSIDKYAIYDCATPHQPAGYRSWVDTWWTIADDPVGSAQKFLAKRRQGRGTSWYAFTRKQERGAAPPRSGKRRISFFTSSEDEIAAIGDELQPDSPFCDQGAAIRAVGAACREKGYEFIIRFHPNTPSSAASLLQAAHAATEFVAEPSSEIDSYALVDSSDVVVSPNSTIAVEAAASGRPAFFTGRGIYENCLSVGKIRTNTELVDAIVNPGEPNPLDALKYANFLGVHGIKYLYYKPCGFLSGTYRGRNLNAPLATIRDLKLRITRGGR